MSTFLTSRWLRWAVPGACAAAVAVGSIGGTVNASASGHPSLPDKTAAQLLASIRADNPPLFSGTIVETTHLGLPDISGLAPIGNDSDLSVQTFLTGSHTLRMFYGGPAQQRLALLGQSSESDVVHNGTDLWTYSSTTREVTHATLPTPDAKPATPSTIEGLTPLAAAQKALAALDPSTAVTVDRTAYVANRSAYQVLLTPRDSRSLVGSVRLAFDAATSLPLRVQIFARGAASPALQVGFTDITMGAPDASIFHFVKPAGTTVKQQKIPFVGGSVADQHLAGSGQPPAGSSVIGTGWTAVAVLPNTGDRSATSGMLNRIGTRVNGGWIVTSALITAEITDSGKVYVGAVSATDLEQVAATGKAL